MNKWEEDMIEQLRKKSEDIQIPDSLRPDQIEKRLSERPKKYHWKKGYTAVTRGSLLSVGMRRSVGDSEKPTESITCRKTRYSNRSG